MAAACACCAAQPLARASASLSVVEVRIIRANARESLSAALQEELNSKGVALIPLPKEEINYDKLKIKACKQYAIKDFSENMILLDTGDAKLMTSYYPVEKLRRLPGMENARYVDPCAGSKGNSIRYLSVAYRSNAMTVDGISNLLCAGEKSGLFIGHTEAITTGTLAGHNEATSLQRLTVLSRKGTTPWSALPSQEETTSTA